MIHNSLIFSPRDAESSPLVFSSSVASIFLQSARDVLNCTQSKKLSLFCVDLLDEDDEDDDEDDDDEDDDDDEGRQKI